jgi:hypothetical protein
MLLKCGGDNGSTCGKKGYFTWYKNLLHSLHLFSVVSPVCRVGNPLSIPENLFLDYPVNTSISCLSDYARVEYTTHKEYTSLDT